MKLVYIPIEIKTKGKLIESSYSLFQYDGSTWVCENEERYYTSGIQMDEKAEETINKQENRWAMLKFFEKLERFDIKFEKSQKRMLLSTQNTIALGRSGTGKTTVSAFKVLAIDLLFKAYSKGKLIGNRKANGKTVQLDAKDLSIYAG